jgi:hypothetical protein
MRKSPRLVCDVPSASRSHQPTNILFYDNRAALFFGPGGYQHLSRLIMGHCCACFPDSRRFNFPIPAAFKRLNFSLYPLLRFGISCIANAQLHIPRLGTRTASFEITTILWLAPTTIASEHRIMSYNTFFVTFHFALRHAGYGTTCGSWWMEDFIPWTNYDVDMRNGCGIDEVT